MDINVNTKRKRAFGFSFHKTIDSKDFFELKEKNQIDIFQTILLIIFLILFYFFLFYILPNNFKIFLKGFFFGIFFIILFFIGLFHYLFIYKIKEENLQTIPLETTSNFLKKEIHNNIEYNNPLETCIWFNALFRRILLEYFQSNFFRNKWKQKLTNLFQSTHKPDYIVLFIKSLN